LPYARCLGIPEPANAHLTFAAVTEDATEDETEDEAHLACQGQAIWDLTLTSSMPCCRFYLSIFFIIAVLIVMCVFRTIFTFSASLGSLNHHGKLDLITKQHVFPLRPYVTSATMPTRILNKSAPPNMCATFPD